MSECSWTSDIRFEKETKGWLNGLEWPDTAFTDFDKIGDHNELRERYCS